MALVKISNHLMRDPETQIALRQKFPGQTFKCIDEKVDSEVHTYKIDIPGFGHNDKVKINLTKHVNGNLVVSHIGPDTETELNSLTVSLLDLKNNMEAHYKNYRFQLDEFFKTLRYDLSSTDEPLVMEDVLNKIIPKNQSIDYYDKFEIFCGLKPLKKHMISEHIKGKKYEVVSKISDQVVILPSFRHDYFKLKTILND